MLAFPHNLKLGACVNLLASLGVTEDALILSIKSGILLGRGKVFLRAYRKLLSLLLVAFVVAA